MGMVNSLNPKFSASLYHTMGASKKDPVNKPLLKRKKEESRNK